MGWCSGTSIFDCVASDLLDDESEDFITNEFKAVVLWNLMIEMERKDWDCHQDSEYYDHPIVQGILSELHPEWVRDEEDF